MKKRNVILVFTSLLALAAPQFASASKHPLELVSISPRTLFVPPGFDENDISQIVITGTYPNTCYKVGPTSIEVDKENHEIRVNSQAYRFTETACLQMTVPYQKVIDIGILDVGNYKIKFENREEILMEYGSIQIQESSTETSDNHLYAPVNQITLTRKHEKFFVTVSGNFSSTCLKMDHLEIIETGRVVEVLPIAKIEGETCEAIDVPFSWTQEVEFEGKGQALFHVRVLNGESLNQVFRLY